jgi:L-asparaginase/Glu-tRNA(Gln) amidotransferase subunit D
MYVLTKYCIFLGNEMKKKKTTLSEQFQNPNKKIIGKIDTLNTQIHDR